MLGECMADKRGDTHGVAQSVDPKRLIRRRRLVLALGALLGVVVICCAAIVIMLQRLETRNANFQPPMTALERQRLLPADPVLDAAPRLEGLRYGAEGDSPAQPTVMQQAAQLSHVPLTQMSGLAEGGNLGVNHDLRAVSHSH